MLCESFLSPKRGAAEEATMNKRGGHMRKSARTDRSNIRRDRAPGRKKISLERKFQSHFRDLAKCVRKEGRMLKKYERAEMEIIRLESEDGVVTTDPYTSPGGAPGPGELTEPSQCENLGLQYSCADEGVLD